MIYRSINLPIFARIGRGILKNLAGTIMEENLYFKEVAILTGNYGEKLVVENNIESQFTKLFIFNLRKNKDISYVRSAIIAKKVELLLAIGGGEIIDLGKYFSMEISIPLISVPTILSNDGIASPISIIKQDGIYKSLGVAPPIGLLADTEVLIKAPKIYLLSGVGDLVSNFSAILDWDLAYKENKEKIDFLARNISLNSVTNILYNFIKGKYGDFYNDDFLEDLFNGLIMSAISMIVAKSSRPASGAEHNISHALDKLGICNLHGIQVGFATLFTLFLHGAYDILEDIIMLYKQIGFPLSFESIGIREKDFTEALKIAPFIRNRYTILSKFSMDYILTKFTEFKRNYLI